VYLFDTDIISNLLKKRPDPGLLRRISAISPELQFTSAITAGELVYGAYRSSRPEYFLEKLETLVWPHLVILPFDYNAARIYGKLRSSLEREGIPLSEPDLRIASIALNRQFTLITGNIRHFGRIRNLQVANWLT